ncbi:hypothetical protein [Streptomyces sp. CLCI03]
MQRRATRVQYLWDKRATMYQDLLRDGGGKVAHRDDDGAFEQYGWADEREKLRRDLTARVQLFGSPAVEERWRAFSRAEQQLDFYVVENLLVSDGDRSAVLSHDADQDSEYVRLKGEVSATRQALTEQARREVGTDPLLRGSGA